MQRIIGNQYKKPTGILGKIIAHKMIKGNIHDYERVISQLNIKQNDRLFEIGYGIGFGVDKISSDYDCFVSGIDFSKVMFNIATKRNRKHIENKKVELLYGDFLGSAIISGSFDTVFCLNVIYFWDKLDEPFSKINALLKKGGLLCIFMCHRDFMNTVKFTKDGIFNKYSIEEVVDKLKSAGFESIRYDYAKKGYVIKCRK